MSGERADRRAVLRMRRTAVTTVADVYNDAGDNYVAYADGDPANLFAFEGQHAYADRRLWSLLAAKLVDLRSTGASSVSFLDAGCGPGTWLRRLVSHARQLGFTDIAARGFDLASEQIRTARRMASALGALPGVTLTFDVADLTAPLPEAEGSVDITLCLYSVLSHLPVADLPLVSAEFARVTRGQFITTVRAVGSVPTIFVDSIENARHFQLDHRLDLCEIEHRDGRHFMVDFHLFNERELRGCFAADFEILDVSGLDVFCSRFLPDRRWNPAPAGDDAQFADCLAELEATYARNPCFIERATHLMLVGRRHPRK
jgi:SAM-dependent methyltransferase